MSYEIKGCCKTDKGLVRSHNEDNYFFDGRFLKEIKKDDNTILSTTFLDEDNKYFSVFDGMGGESHGEKASYLAAKVMNDNFTNFESYIEDANNQICKEQDKKYRMGTTVAAIQFKKEHIKVCNLGDSKIFFFKNDDLVQVSVDHTDKKLVEKMNKDKKPSLTQHLGIYKDEIILNPFIKNIKYSNNTIILVCSDGLTDMVTNEEIRKTLSKEIPLVEKIEELNQKAYQNGAKDNITIMLFEIIKENKSQEKRKKGIILIPIALVFILIIIILIALLKKDIVRDNCNSLKVNSECEFIFDSKKYNLEISNEKIVEYQEDKLIGKQAGSTIVTVKDKDGNIIYENKIVVFPEN